MMLAGGSRGVVAVQLVHLCKVPAVPTHQPTRPPDRLNWLKYGTRPGAVLQSVSSRGNSVDLYRCHGMM